MNMKCSGGKRKLKNTNSATQNLRALNVSSYIPFKTKQKPCTNDIDNNLC